jgi:signal-transduction protein with cAMP-binding, CBS, and nucleotidyltransferase domain
MGMEFTALADKQARDYMAPLTAVVGPMHHLNAAARAMISERAGSVIVIDPSLPGPGLLSERDLAVAIAAGADPATDRVETWMRHDIASISPDTSLDAAARTMLRQGVRHCVVIDGGEPAGVISLRYLIGLVLGEDAQLPPPPAYGI